MTNTLHQPTILVILGATGDLTHRKIVPSLYQLYRKGKLPKLFHVLGFSRQNLSDADFQERVRSTLELILEPESIDREQFTKFLALFHYQQGEFATDTDFDKLAQQLGRVDGEWKTCANKLFYLAVPPDSYENIFEQLSRSGLTIPCSDTEGWTRVIVEKPFGNNAKTAQHLDLKLSELFKEEQIYRIDHYLAKEMVQNILILRFTNDLFRRNWDSEMIEKIEVRLLENIGVENRADSFDKIGSLRDVGQNHLLQMLALTIMDRPVSFEADDIRASRLAALQNLRPFTEEQVALQTYRAQYAGYRELEGITPNSDTETYFKIRLNLEAPNYQNVPIIIESGKSLTTAKKEIIINFRHHTPCLCPGNDEHYKNSITMSIEPEESISLRFWLKKPGLDWELEERKLNFFLRDMYDLTIPTEGYEKLLLDCIMGDQTLFISTDEVAAMWNFIDPIRLGWDKGLVALDSYTPQSDEPAEKSKTIES